jgi:hypothetical protein
MSVGRIIMMHFDGRRGHHNEVKQNEEASLRKEAKKYCIVVAVWCGSGRFALSFHTSTFYGVRVTWLGKYQEREASMSREEGKKDIIIIIFTLT